MLRWNRLLSQIPFLQDNLVLTKHMYSFDGSKRKEMKHTYHVTGMSCNGCKSHVESALVKVPGVLSVEVDLTAAEATIEMENHIEIDDLKKALEGSMYEIFPHGHEPEHDHAHKSASLPPGQGTGVFYCPMHCEGDKTYDKPGDCPVCGMDLVEEQNLKSSASGAQWTCPMHPEILEDEPGACPICGMDLVPTKPEP